MIFRIRPPEAGFCPQKTHISRPAERDGRSRLGGHFYEENYFDFMDAPGHPLSELFDRM
jgi:hypothetical protein